MKHLAREMTSDTLPAEPSAISGRKRRRREKIRQNTRAMREQLRESYRPVDRHLLVFSILMRLPSFMIALSVLLVMAHQTGEVSLGAYAAGLVALSSAATHRTYRNLSRRVGYRRVLMVAATLNIPAVAFLMIQTGRFTTSGAGGSIILLLLAALLAGLTTAPLGSIMRLFWGGQYKEVKYRNNLIYASAFESILDVIALPVAAAIVGLVSILGGVQSSLFAVIVINVVGMMFVLWKPSALNPQLLGSETSEPRVEDLGKDSQQLGWLPMLGATFLGIAIGATQSALVIRAVQTETLETVGIYLGIMGVAGAVTCLFLVGNLQRFATWEGWLLIAGLLVMATLTLSLPRAVFWMIFVLIFFGCAIGAALMCMDTIITRLSARGNIVLAHSSTQSTYIGGLALGYVWAVLMSKMTGQSASLLVPLVAATLFFCTGHLFGFQWRRRYEERLDLLQLERAKKK